MDKCFAWNPFSLPPLRQLSAKGLSGNKMKLNLFGKLEQSAFLSLAAGFITGGAVIGGFWPEARCPFPLHREAAILTGKQVLPGRTVALSQRQADGKGKTDTHPRARSSSSGREQQPPWISAELLTSPEQPRC